MRILYRVRQFWRAIFLTTYPQDPEQARDYLTPAQWSLFRQLQPVEQDHALRMLNSLLAQGESLPDLLVAALLHDVGKLRHPLNPVERAMVVLVKALLPQMVQRWGQVPADGLKAAPGWRKAFILAVQHAEWGAQMARSSGVSPQTERLIRHHHDLQPPLAAEAENRLLHKLWIVDNEIERGER